MIVKKKRNSKEKAKKKRHVQDMSLLPNPEMQEVIDASIIEVSL